MGRRLLLLAVVIVMPLSAAPVPKAKPKPPPAIEGTWRASWDCFDERDSYDGTMYFGDDGTHWHQYDDGVLFVGRWEWMADGTLRVFDRKVTDRGLDRENCWHCVPKFDGRAGSWHATTGGTYPPARWAVRGRVPLEKKKKK